MLAPTLPDLSRLDREALQTLLLAEHQERIATHEQLLQREQQLLERESEIETLKLLLSQLRRMQFGRKSEKLERQIEQLELRLEDLQLAQAAEQTTETCPAESSPPVAKVKPVRQPLPEHLPRQTQTHEPKHSACPDCGGELRKLGEDVSEMLEYVPECFRVIRHPSCAPEAELPTLRTDSASGGTEPADCTWTGGTRSAGTCIDLKICGPSSPLPAMRNL